MDLASFVVQVQTEFVQLFSYFHEGRIPDGKLPDLLAKTVREAADHTTRLVGTMNEMVREQAECRAQLHKRVSSLETEVSRDQLTGVLNRSGFSGRFKELLSKAARYGTSLAVCYLDVDHFKKLNDTYGHALGDAVLQAAVAQAQGVLSQDTVMGRMGGDEFVIVLSGCAEDSAREMASRVVAAVAELGIEHEGQEVRVTWSAGLLYVRPTNEPQEMNKLLRAADQLMYEAKRKGGNRVEAGAQ